MDLDSNLLRGLLTVILMGAFVGVCFWAWSGKRKPTFDAMSRLPLEEDSDVEGDDDDSGRHAK